VQRAVLQSLPFLALNAVALSLISTHILVRKRKPVIPLPMTNHFFSALFAKDSAFENVRIVLSALSAPLFSLFLDCF